MNNVSKTWTIVGIFSGITLFLSLGFMASVTIYYVFIEGQRPLTISRVVSEEHNPKQGMLTHLEVTYDINRDVCNGRIPDLIEAEIVDSNGVVTKVSGYSHYKESRNLVLGQEVYFYSWNDVILDYGQVGYSPEPIYVKIHDAWN